MSFTLLELRRLTAIAREHAVKPKTIQSELEARRMNNEFEDRQVAVFGQVYVLGKFKAGDKYYELHTVKGKLEWKE